MRETESPLYVCHFSLFFFVPPPADFISGAGGNEEDQEATTTTKKEQHVESVPRFGAFRGLLGAFCRYFGAFRSRLGAFGTSNVLFGALSQVI